MGRFQNPGYSKPFVNCGSDKKASRDLQFVEEVEEPLDADVQAIVAPGIISHVRLRRRTGRSMTEALAKMKVFHIYGHVKGEPLAARPFVAFPFGYWAVALASVRFEHHRSSRSACSNQPITRAR